MVSYDGSEFIALNDEIVDAEVAPADTFIRHILYAQNEFLLRGADAVNCTYVDGATKPGDGAPFYGGRPWASFAPACVSLTPYWLESGVNGPLVHLYISQDSAWDVDIWVVLRQADGTVVGLSSTYSAHSLTNDYEDDAHHVTLPVDLTTPYQGPEQYGRLEVWVRSHWEDTAVDTWTPGAVINEPITAEKDLYITDTVSYAPTDYPSDGHVGLSFLITSESGDGADLLGLYYRPTLTGERLLIDRTLTAFVGEDVQQTALGWVQCRGISIQRRRFNGSVTQISKNMLAAELVEDGSVAAAQAQKARKYHDSPRLLSFGPAGWINQRTDEHQLYGIPSRWTHTWAYYNPPDDLYSTLIDDSLVVRREQPTIDVTLLLISSIHTGWAGSDIGSAQWDITVSVQEMGGSALDWTGATTIETITETIDVTAWPSAAEGVSVSRSRFLRQRRFSMTGFEFGDKGSTDDQQTAFRDSHLYSEDFALITPVTITLDLDLDVSDLDRLFRLRVHGEYVDNSLTGISEGGAAASAAISLGDQLELCCVGYAVHQRGGN